MGHGYLTSTPSTSFEQIGVGEVGAETGSGGRHWGAFGTWSQIYSNGLPVSFGEPRALIEATMAMTAITTTSTGIGTNPFTLI